MSKNTQLKNDIFISYNHKSKEYVEGLYHVLTKQYNLNVWVDFKKLKVGESLSLKINEGLKDSRLVIACVTKSYSQSRSCQNELVLAHEYQKPLLIIILEELKLKDIPEISFYISHLNRCSLYKVVKDGDIWNSKKFKEEILSSIEAILEIDLSSYERLNDFSTIEVKNTENESISLESNDLNTNISKWIESLKLVKLDKWSYMISTPSEEQTKIVMEALINSNCPLMVLNELIEKSNERNWPVGLSNIFQREKHFSEFKKYKCRQLYNKNIIAVMSDDNRHIQNNLIDDKIGFIIVFREDTFYSISLVLMVLENKIQENNKTRILQMSLRIAKDYKKNSKTKIINFNFFY